MSENKESKGFKNPFQSMDEEKKKYLIGAGLLGVVVISGLAYYFNSKIESENKSKVVDKSNPPVSVLERDVSKEKWTTEESKKVAELQEKQKQLEELLKKAQEQQNVNKNPDANLPPIVMSSPSPTPPQPVQSLPSSQPLPPPPPPLPSSTAPQSQPQYQPYSNNLQNLPPIDSVVEKPKPKYTVMNDLIEYSGQNQNQGQNRNLNNANLVQNQVQNENQGQNQVVSVSESGSAYSNASNMKNYKKNIATYIPAGTFSRVVLLSGVDAPSASSASGNPVPVLFKIKDLSILPNKFRSDFRECFIIGSARGDLRSERAYIRAETLSCVKRDGSVLERGITGYVAGEDGKAGLSGRVVTKAGQMIARSILAGFVEGVARAFSQQAMIVNVSPLGQTSTVDPDQTFKYGLGQGISSGSRKLVEYYLNMANNLIPVIEVNAGREVDFVFLKGVDLSEEVLK